MFRHLFSWSERRQEPPNCQPCEKCGQPATMYVYDVRGLHITKEQYLCGQCATQHLWMPNPNPLQVTRAVAAPNQEVPLEVERGFTYYDSGQHYYILREVGGPRHLTLTTGYYEAAALWWFLKDDPKPRPLTHDVWLASLSALGGKVESACVYDRHGDIYFAEIRLSSREGGVKVDARPSDALLLTLRAGVPFRFTERLLDQYAVSEPEPA